MHRRPAEGCRCTENGRVPLWRRPDHSRRDDGPVQLQINTPALVFPVLGFLLLPYTTRYLALADLIRRLHREYADEGRPMVGQQIEILRKRLSLIRLMQSLAVLSMLLAVISMLTLYGDWQRAAKTVFALCLLALAASLIVSLWEIQLSLVALNLQLGPGDILRD